MKILVATNSAHLPQQTGGSEVTVHDLVNILIAEGHEVKVLTSLLGSGFIYFKNRLISKLAGKKYPADVSLGYCTFRGFPVEGSVLSGVKEVLQEWRPDIIFVTGARLFQLVNDLQKTNMPLVCSLVDVQSENYENINIENLRCIFVANSNFTKEKIKDRFSISMEVIPPFINFSKFEDLLPSNKKYITLINPHPYKGVEIALKLAELNPAIEFLFVQSWPLAPVYKQELLDKIKKLGNILYSPPVSDMRHIYAQTKILLVPSQYEEAWGRVVNEAQYHGIPVIASDRGGLPESVGDGGVLVPFDAPIEVWSRALNELLINSDSYANKSKAGYSRIHFGDLSASLLMAKWLNVFHKAIQLK